MSKYGYVGDIPHLNKEEILTRVPQQDIFSIVMECQLGTYYVSPFREDSTAGAYFDWHGHKLFFVDFGDTVRTHRDCFNVIQDTYNISFNETLVMIDNHFNLGFGEGKVAIPAKVELRPSPKKILRNRTDIVYQRRNFHDNDRLFWQPYGITSRQLIEDEVLPIIWYRLYSHRLKKEIINRPKTVCYAYNFHNRVKIYTPHASKELKWVTNCTANDVGSIDDLPIYGRKLIITKSYKDCRILRNMGIKAIWFQNEGMLPNDHILTSLCKRFDSIIVLFDSDATGIAATHKVVSKLNSMFPGIATPASFTSGGNDTGEFYLNNGKPQLLKFLNEKGLM